MNDFGSWVLADTPGGHEALRKLVDPRLATSSITSQHQIGPSPGRVGTPDTASVAAAPDGCDRDSGPNVDGRLAGTALIQKPHIAMSTLAALGAMGDLAHFERMQCHEKPDGARQQSCSRTWKAPPHSPSDCRPRTTSQSEGEWLGLPTSASSTPAASPAVMSEMALSGVLPCREPRLQVAAARGCINAALALRATMTENALRSDLASEDLTMHFGLHWGATLYVGQISTAGRTEIAALGDEVNEGARIEACATGGRTLASKNLVERLAPDDARALASTSTGSPTPNSVSSSQRPTRAARCAINRGL